MSYLNKDKKNKRKHLVNQNKSVTLQPQYVAEDVVTRMDGGLCADRIPDVFSIQSAGIRQNKTFWG